MCLVLCAGSEGSGVKPDWAHVYLSVLSVLPLHLPRDEGRVAAALRAAAAAITARHAAQLRRAAVAQWEVRLRVPDKSGAWRVVVAAPTGHEAGEECVEVYREAVGQDARIVYSSRHNIGGGCGLWRCGTGSAGGHLDVWVQLDGKPDCAAVGYHDRPIGLMLSML